MDVLNARWVLMGGEYIACISTDQVEIVEIGRSTQAAPEPFVLGLTKQVRYKSCGTSSWPTRCATGSPPASAAPLASEAELGREYGVSRVTVRRALELLRDEGLVTARQGVGLVRRGRPGPPVARAGHDGRGRARSGRRRSRVARCSSSPSSPPRPTSPRRSTSRPTVRSCASPALNLADDEPFAVVTVWVAATLGRAPEPRRRRALDVLRPAPAARCRAGSGRADDHRARGGATDGAPARRSRRLTAAGVPEGHLRSPRTRGHRRRAPLRGPPHRARSRISRHADPRRPPWLSPSPRSRPSRSSREAYARYPERLAVIRERLGDR